MVKSAKDLLASALRTWWYEAYTAYQVRHLPIKPSFRRSLNLPDRLFLLEFYPALLGDDMIVHDIGAASGTFSSFAASLSNVREIHAFEPLPSAYAELVDISTKSAVPIICHNVALGEFNGQSSMSVPEISRDSSSLLEPNHVLDHEVGEGAVYQQLVRVVRLDDYVQENKLPLPDVVKMDVQGYEDRVLRGGSQTISAARFCVIEVNFEPLYEQSALFDDVYLLLREYGFCLIGMNNPACGYVSQQLQANAIFAKA